MSLDWYVADVDNYKERCWVECEDGEYVLSPMTNTLIWAAMRIGMNGITEKNWNEFYARMLLDPRSRREDGYLFIKPEDVKAHIGLSTNVSSVSRTKWFKALMEEALFEARCTV
jgi:hypothetical protein